MTPSEFALAPGVRPVLFDDEVVVFNPFTWETHILNAAATLVFERIRAGPCTQADIEALLLDVLEESEKTQAREHAERLVRHLSGLKLLAVPAETVDANR